MCKTLFNNSVKELIFACDWDNIKNHGSIPGLGNNNTKVSLKINSDQIFDEHFVVTGTNLETGLVEIIEYNNHPWFVGVQFHPEYKSTVSKPHPLFVAFIKASLAKKGEV